MRIIAGTLGGRRLVAPSGDSTRPTSDAAREAMFNVLAHGVGHEPRVVLDLFAGTGALSFEAISRGAERALLIEKDPKAIKAIEANCDALALTQGVHVIREERLERWPQLAFRSGLAPFDTVFCDPPYGKDLITRAFRSLDHEAAAPLNLFTADALLVVEFGTKDSAPKLNRWTLVKERERGTTRVSYYRRAGGA